jgi:hypothetical protein
LRVADTTKTLAVPGEGPGWFDVRRALSALPPPIPRLPPGVGNQADKLEYEYLELAKKRYDQGLGQTNRHALPITANGDDGEISLPVGLAHLSRRLLDGDVWHDCTRTSGSMSSAAVGPELGGPMVRGGPLRFDAVPAPPRMA